MGFFSGIFGSSSEWDGSKYVEQVVGKKLWHAYFIDKDAMRSFGWVMAMQDYPLDIPRNPKQSPYTLVGELVYLMRECGAKNDLRGQKAVVLAMKKILETQGKLLQPIAELRFISAGYSPFGSDSNSSEAEAPSEQQDPSKDGTNDLMEEARSYGMTYDGSKFSFQNNQYDRLEDAINYAMLVERKR